jgi:hypothetical protein
MRISHIDFIESLPKDSNTPAFSNIQGGNYGNDRTLSLEIFGLAFAQGNLFAHTLTRAQIRLFKFSSPTTY